MKSGSKCTPGEVPHRPEPAGPPERRVDFENFAAAAATDGPPAAFTGATGESTWTDDLDLVQRTLQGDRAAGHAFVDRMVCIPRFLRRFEQRSGAPFGDDGLTDLSQEVAARVWRDRSRFSGRSRLESWVFGYARHVYLEALATRRNRDGRHTSLGDESVDPIDPCEGVDDAIAHQIDAQAILDLVDALPARDSEVIRAKLLDGEPFSRIAQRRNEDINAVKTRYYRALERIRGRLAAEPHRREERG